MLHGDVVVPVFRYGIDHVAESLLVISSRD